MSSLNERRSSPSPSPSPHLTAASLLAHSHIPIPSSSSTTASPSSLHRRASRSSPRSGLVPSPFNGYNNSASSSTSESRNGSFISTPKLLSRRNSSREPQAILTRRDSGKGQGKGREEGEMPGSSGISKTSEVQEGWPSPFSESGSPEV